MEYQVTVRSSEGEQAPITVHARSADEAWRRAEKATGLTVVEIWRAV